MSEKPLAIPGATQPKSKALQSDIIRLRRGARIFEEETTSSITTINQEIDSLDDVFVKSVPIREIVIMERTEWEAVVTPDPTVLYCVYDEA